MTVSIEELQQLSDGVAEVLELCVTQLNATAEKIEVLHRAHPCIDVGHEQYAESERLAAYRNELAGLCRTMERWRAAVDAARADIH